MWAQLITMHAKADKLDQLPALFEQLRSAEQPGSGLTRTIAMQDQKDPLTVYTLVVFESEDAARAREQDPRRQEMLAAAQATMAEVFDAPPQFVDLTVLVNVEP
jgi:quinol monooxygenase YgiN